MSQDDQHTNVRVELESPQAPLDVLEAIKRSLPARPLSRRALIRSASVAPLLLAANCAWTKKTPVAIEELAALCPIAEDEMQYVRTQVAIDVPGIDVNQFEIVARFQWRHLCIGLQNVEMPDSVRLFEYAYDLTANDLTRKTGAVLGQNVKTGMFDPTGSHYQTNHCAYICGHKAALLAVAAGRCEVTRDDYKQARKETEKEMLKKLTCARALSGSGPDLGGGC